MNESKHGIIVDKNGNKIEFVLVETVPVPVMGEDGKPKTNASDEQTIEWKETPYGYDMREGERIIYDDIPSALSMIKPKWTGKTWKETATPEEIEEARPSLLLDMVKNSAIKESKRSLAVALDMPIRFNDKLYSVTMEKQNLLSAQLGLFGLNTQAGIQAELSWNATGEQCVPWAYEDLLALSNAIVAHVTPLVKLQREAELNINAGKTAEEIQNIVQEYKLSLDSKMNE